MRSSVPGNTRAEKRLMEILTRLLFREHEKIEQEMEATFAGARCKIEISFSHACHI